jgi:hypothetical protein
MRMNNRIIVFNNIFIRDRVLVTKTNLNQCVFRFMHTSNVTSKNVNNSEELTKYNSLTSINDIKIIASICKSKLEIVDRKGLKSQEVQYLASIMLYIGDLNMKKLISSVVDVTDVFSTIKVIKISLYNLKEKNSLIKDSRVLEKNGVAQEGTLILQEVNFFSFLKNLDTYLSMYSTNAHNDSLDLIKDVEVNESLENKDSLGNIIPSPIFIFEGISWSNIVYLFKLNGLILNGGSISKRHMLNLCELKLAMFIAFAYVDLDKNEFDKNYAESQLTNPKYEEFFYKYNKGLSHEGSFTHTSPVIYQYYKLNYLVENKIKKENLLKEIERLEIEIVKETNSLSYLDENIEGLKGQISQFWVNRNLELAKQKHKIVLGARFKELKRKIAIFINEKEMLENAIQSESSKKNILAKKKLELNAINTKFVALENLESWSSDNKLVSYKNSPDLKVESNKVLNSLNDSDFQSYLATLSRRNAQNSV